MQVGRDTVIDFFLSLILWFILDDKKGPAVFVVGGKVYSVVAVTATRKSLDYDDCDGQEVDAQSNSVPSTHSSGV
jgi:hypothetical protein